MVGEGDAPDLSPRSQEKHIIDARGLVKTFRKGSVLALDGIDFEANAGDLIAVTGPSGSGKSTLLYALSGLVKLDSGIVQIDGVKPDSAAGWVKLRSHQIGLVFQEDWLLATLSAAENVEFPMMGVEHNAAARRARVRELLELVGASALADRRPAGLSGGERQRVAVARSLANRPRILLADEPTGELDSRSSRSIIELLFTLQRKEGLTVIIVTHDQDIAAAFRRHYVVVDGKGSYID